MSSATVAVVNQSTVVAAAGVRAVVTALQQQVTRDFGPVWGRTATLQVTTGAPPAGAWQLVILDDTDQAGALGYHELTASGQPIAKVFAQTAQQAGVAWSVTASHELMEMLVDPDINLTVFDQPAADTGTLYMYEACDAVEAQSYAIGAVQVSNFVTPYWFMPGTTGHPLDHLGNVSTPLALAPGGYIAVFDVTAGSGWTDRTDAATWTCSRHDRRRLPRDAWRRSER